MGKRLAKRDVKPDLILSSLARRALKTARIIAKKLDYKLKDIVVEAVPSQYPRSPRASCSAPTEAALPEKTGRMRAASSLIRRRAKPSPGSWRPAPPRADPRPNAYAQLRVLRKRPLVASSVWNIGSLEHNPRWDVPRLSLLNRSGR